MYTRLLGSALDERHLGGPPPTTGQALAELVGARGALDDRATHPGRGRDPGLAVVHQLAYDVALVQLARLLRVQVDLEGFDQPHRERDALEHRLRDRGVRLDGFGESPTGTPVR
jgi:hypothetical protein